MLDLPNRIGEVGVAVAVLGALERKIIMILNFVFKKFFCEYTFN